MEILKGNDMTTAEWIEYYRFHPSEFESFIKFVEGEISKRDTEIDAQSGRIAKLETAIKSMGDIMNKELPYVTDGGTAYKIISIIRATLKCE